jgi:hypothetical protein
MQAYSRLPFATAIFYGTNARASRKLKRQDNHAICHVLLMRVADHITNTRLKRVGDSHEFLEEFETAKEWK